MKLNELKQRLAGRPELTLRFRLPGGSMVAAHAHVTEVARVDKRFIDCGGTLRTESYCRLQTWVAKDILHRLTAGKLAGILNQAGPVLQAEDLEVDIEHEDGVISQYPLETVEASGHELILALALRHTACLAEDRCIRPINVIKDFLTKTLPKFK